MRSEWEMDEWLRRLCLNALSLDRDDPEYMKNYKKVERRIRKMDETQRRSITRRQEKIYQELVEFLRKK